jgi:hypothetical protein
MRRLLIGLILFLAGLLVGFVPQYMKARHFEWQSKFCNASLQMAQIRRSAALTYVSATQMNYGTAAGYANQMFEEAQQLSANNADPSTQPVLANLLSSRDKIMNDLSKGNAQVVSELQPILMEVQGAGK